jgi:RHS repeat-associated protein
LDLGRDHSSECPTYLDAPHATYTYDPLDRLRTITVGSATNRFRYVGPSAAVAQIVDGSGTVLSNHATDLSGVELYDFTPGGSIQTYLGRNDHDDVTWTADLTGAVTARASYDPYGNLVSSSGAMPYTRWQGSYFDGSSGLYYVNARWYSPGLGSFLSDDPVAHAATNPQDRDPYAYGAGDSVDQIDPSGQCSLYAPSPYDPSCAAAFFGKSVAAYDRAQASLTATKASPHISYATASPSIPCTYVSYFAGGSGGCSSKYLDASKILPLNPTVPWYKTNREKWTSQPMGTCGATVGYVSASKPAEGCLVTSAAMVVGRQNGWTPLEMIRYLNQHGKIVTSTDTNKNCTMLFSWTVAGVHLTNAKSFARIKIGTNSTFTGTVLPTLIEPQLLANRPLIAKVSSAAIPEHFVVVIGWQVSRTGADLVINDSLAKSGGTMLFNSGYTLHGLINVSR